MPPYCERHQLYFQRDDTQLHQPLVCRGCEQERYVRALALGQQSRAEGRMMPDQEQTDQAVCRCGHPMVRHYGHGLVDRLCLDCAAGTDDQRHSAIHPPDVPRETSPTRTK